MFAKIKHKFSQPRLLFFLQFLVRISLFLEQGFNFQEPPCCGSVVTVVRLVRPQVYMKLEAFKNSNDITSSVLTPVSKTSMF